MRSSWHCTLAEAKETGGDDVAAKVPCRVEDPLDNSSDFSFIHRCLGEYLVAKYIATSPDAAPLDVLRGLPSSVTIPILHLIQRDPRSCATLQQQTAVMLLRNCAVNNQGIESLRQQLNELEARFGKNDVSLIPVLNLLGGCLNEAGKTEEALTLMQRALQIQIAIVGRDGAIVAGTHTNIANVHLRQAKDEPARGAQHRQVAKQHAERALEIIDSQKFPNDEEIADVLLVIAEAISAQDPCKAKLHLERALRIQMALFGPNHDEVASTMLRLGGVVGQLGDSAAATKMMQSALPVLESHYGPDHLVVAVALLNASTFDDGIFFRPKEHAQILRRCIKTLTEYYGPTNYQVAFAESRLAKALFLLGKPLEAKELVEKALPVLERHFGRDSVEVGVVLKTLGRCYCNLDNPLKKRELHYRALKIFESQYGPNHLSVGIALADLALDYGDPKQEIIFLQRALPILEKDGGPNSVHVADALTDLGDAMNAVGRAVESIPILERALAILKVHFGPSDVKLVRALSGLATANGCRGDHAKKLELLTTALSIAESFYGPDHFELSRILNNLANAYGDCGDAKTKLEMSQRSRRIKEKFYTETHRNGSTDIAVSMVNEGGALLSQGRWAEARKVLEKAVELKEAKFGRNSIELAKALTNLGIAYKELREFDKAKDALSRAVKLSEDFYGHDHIEVAVPLGNLGNTYYENREYAKAKESLKRTVAIKEAGNRPPRELSIFLMKVAACCNALGETREEDEYVRRAESLGFVPQLF